MEIKLIRITHSGEAIDGQLYVDGQLLCDTVENEAGALPAGNYQIVRHFCEQYERHIPLIVGKGTPSPSIHHPSPSGPPCSRCTKIPEISNNALLPVYCPQLKMGNGVHHRTDGSIILGTQIVPGCLKHTREPYKNLSDRIRKISKRKKEIILTITESQPINQSK